jgi:predicted RNA-binding Zn ribbon-like protein
MHTYDLSPAAAAERLVAFINSHGVGFDAGRDLLDAQDEQDPQDAPASRDAAALGYPGMPFPAGTALAQARALRKLLLDGVGADGAFAERELNAIAGTLPWVYRFDAHGQAAPAPLQDMLPARVLGDLAAVGAAGHWNRIKVCANEACKALFYDTTKARTRRWHSFGQCGNKANVAAHRQRQAHPERHDDSGKI